MSTAKDAARAVRGTPALRAVARAGYVVLGVVHILIGGIAVAIAAGADSVDADQTGAMEQLRSTAVGGLLLLVIAVALIALAVWEFVSAPLEADPDDAKKWGRRLKMIGTSVAYVAIASSALVFAFGGKADSGDSSQTLTARLLAAPGGWLVILLLGLAVFAIGVGFIVSGIRRSFERKLSLPDGLARVAVLTLGIVGYLSKGVAIAVTGILFLVALATRDAEKAAGMDAALRSLIALPFGRLILWVVAIGLIVYGLYCIARARYAKM